MIHSLHMTIMQHLITTSLVSFILLSLLVIPIFSSKPPAIIISFGDSTVDSGNNNHIHSLVKADFPPYGRDFPGKRPTGRFSNGRLGTDFISEAMGLPSTIPAYLDPDYNITDFATGVCFASAGTGFDIATSNLVSVIPMWKQVDYFEEYQDRLSRYIGRENMERTVRDSIYIVSAGFNDFIENYYFTLVTGRFKQSSPGEYQNYILDLVGDFITKLYLLGARKILFIEQPPAGCVPLERTLNMLHGSVCNEEFNVLARDYNAKLEIKVKDLCEKLPGIKLKIGAIYDNMLDVITNPSLYEMENVSEGCCGTGKIEVSYLCNDLETMSCSDADRYVFWDSAHPTEKMNQILAYFLVNTSLAEFI